MNPSPPSRYRVRPSPESSAWAIVAWVVVLGVGIYLTRVGGPLGLIVVLVALASIAYNAFNIFGKRGIASEVIEADQPLASAPASKTPAERLAHLDELRENGLIDITAYQRKRREIIEDV